MSTMLFLAKIHTLSVSFLFTIIFGCGFTFFYLKPPFNIKKGNYNLVSIYVFL